MSRVMLYGGAGEKKLLERVGRDFDFGGGGGCGGGGAVEFRRNN